MRHDATRGGGGVDLQGPKNARWRALVDVGADASGRRQRKKVSGRTRAEVLLKMREVQRDAEDGLASGGRHLTVAALAEARLRHGSGELSASTPEVRTWAVRQHLVPALGARRVRQLSAEDVSLFLPDLGQAGYARASLEKVRGVLIQVLRHAERQGLVARNVAAIVPTPAGPRAKGRSLTAPQARVLLEAAHGHPLEAAFVLGLTCGLRPGELLGLKWEDVDLDQGVLRVSRAVSRVGGKVAFGPTKTASSRRRLRLPAGTQDALRRHRTRQQARQEVMAEHWQDLGLVFPTGRGTLLDPANLPAPGPEDGHREGRPRALAPARAAALRGQPVVGGGGSARRGRRRARARQHPRHLGDVPTSDDADRRGGRGADGRDPRRLWSRRTGSDNLMRMRTVTATEASRSFAALLDEVEAGETVVVTRGGKRIASIGPASVGNGAAVLALLAHDVDEGFAADVAAARDAVTSNGPAWPGD